MRKFVFTLTTTVLLGFSALTSVAAVSDKAPKKEHALTAEQEIKLQRIENRVLEIKNMDKSDLSRSERKALKKELRDMNQQARAITGGGVYLSVGAIIIIILLLILIL
ncbi:hypothetical protein [Desertivirga xinjiangensis]|uniref:hypothetical protein n=1 Tax=Desertivirga xinjiangensis TaxID=539206 RepID=UPI00210AB437|nr:hypothetical protein [Pedobacter xinjiangensis]